MASTFHHTDGGGSVGTSSEHENGSGAGESTGGKSKRELELEKQLRECHRTLEEDCRSGNAEDPYMVEKVKQLTRREIWRHVKWIPAEPDPLIFSRKQGTICKLIVDRCNVDGYKGYTFRKKYKRYVDKTITLTQNNVATTMKNHSLGELSIVIFLSS